MINVDSVIPWATLAALILAIGNATWAIMMRGARQTAEKALKNEGKLIDHDRRIQSVEDEIKHLPSKDEVNGLQVSMTEIRGKLETFNTELSSVERTVRRIDEYLRNKG